MKKGDKVVFVPVGMSAMDISLAAIQGVRVGDEVSVKDVDGRGYVLVEYFEDYLNPIHFSLPAKRTPPVPLSPLDELRQEYAHALTERDKYGKVTSQMDIPIDYYDIALRLYRHYLDLAITLQDHIDLLQNAIKDGEDGHL